MSNNKIKPIRQKIDALDHQILKLIQKRGSLAQKIGDLKGLIDSSKSFYKPDREAEILRGIAKLNEGPIPDNKIKYIFKEIISSCLSLEEEMTIAFLGPEGTHSEGAVIQNIAVGIIREYIKTHEANSDCGELREKLFKWRCLTEQRRTCKPRSLHQCLTQ